MANGACVALDVAVWSLKRRQCFHHRPAAILLAALALPGAGAAHGAPNGARRVVEEVATARERAGIFDWEPVESWETTQQEDVTVDIVIAVAHANANHIEQALSKVSDPASTGYGNHWALGDAMVEALGTQENARRVETWLRQGGAMQVETTRMFDFVKARLGLAEAGLLFDVKLRPVRHIASGRLRAVVDTTGARPSVPIELAEAVDFISGFQLPTPKLPRPTPWDQAQQLAASLPQSGAGHLQLLVVEARDRAFVVHVAVEGGVTLKGFDAIATPFRVGNSGRFRYLPPVHLYADFKSDVCTTDRGDAIENSSVTRQILCTVTLGPSLALVNFAATELKMRSVYANGTYGPWAAFRRYAFPALSTTVDDLRKLYNVPPGFRNRFAKNSQALASFMNISASEADAKLFAQVMGVRRQPPVRFVGGDAPTGVEGNIDLQWIQAMGDNVETTFWYTPGGHAAHEPFLEWLIHLANTTDPPLVHSVSYGENENEFTAAYETRANLEFAKLGLRGVTVLVATGDTGIQGAAQDGGIPPRCAPFAPVWPASSPYVTAVGATMISNHVTSVCDADFVYAMGTNASMAFACPEASIGEIVCSVQRGAMITTGGGFSERFTQPPYQREAVAEYLSTLPAANREALFNRSGRAYPDISAVGQNVPIIFQGKLVMVGGTSSSSPIVAGLVAMLNGERLSASLPPFGFLNPLLYSRYSQWPEIVQDVRVGNNSGGNMLLPQGVDRDCAAGFPAVPGWDAATGLGTPNFGEMLRRLGGMPTRERSSNAKTSTSNFI